MIREFRYFDPDYPSVSILHRINTVGDPEKFVIEFDSNSEIELLENIAELLVILETGCTIELSPRAPKYYGIGAKESELAITERDVSHHKIIYGENSSSRLLREMSSSGYDYLCLFGFSPLDRKRVDTLLATGLKLRLEESEFLSLMKYELSVNFDRNTFDLWTTDHSNFTSLRNWVLQSLAKFNRKLV